MIFRGFTWLLLLCALALLLAPAAHAQCVGCTTTTVGGDTVHTWTSGTGSFTPPFGVTSVQVLVVGGGGGGGFPIDRTGGGGGAGGLISNAAFAVAGTVTVTVGAGGNGGTGAGGSTAGGNSVFGSLTAIGGGRGGTGPGAGGVYATAGGSGGGGYHNPSDSGKAGTAGQGNAGGTGYDSTNTSVGFKAGGGGGAGGAGTTATPTVNGTGGVGLQNNISGTALFYAGGGGGGIQVYTGTILGGSGVGGNGGANGAAGTAGTANRGGGGGGGSQNITSGVTGAGGAGGSGIVIVRYTTPTGRYAVATGNWDATSTWSAGGCAGAAGASVPAAGADVTICNTRTVTLNANTANLASLTIQGNGVLNIGNNTTARTVTVSGDVNIVNNTGILRYNTAATHSVSIGGALNNSGTVTSANVGSAKTMTVTGLITNSGTFRFAGSAVLTVNANGGIANTGTFDVDTASNQTHLMNVGSDISNAGTFNLATDGNSLVTTTWTGGGTHNITGNGAMTFSNVTVNNNLVVNKGAGAITQSGTFTVNGTLTLTAGTLDLNNTVTVVGTAGISGTLNTGGSNTKSFNGAVTVNSSGTATLGASAVTFGSTVGVAGTLRCNSNTGNKNFNGAVTVNNGGVLDLEACTANFNDTTTIQSGGTLELTASATGDKTFTGAVTINSGGTWNNSANEAVAMGNSLTNNGTFNSGTGTYAFQTTAGAVWAGSSGLVFGGAVNVNASRTNNTTTTVAGTLALAAGVTVTNNSTVTASGAITGANATTSIWTNTANSTLNVAGALLATGTLNASANGNTVHYNGSGNQAVKLPSGGNYHHLTISTGGTKTPVAGTYNIGGNLTINAGPTFQVNTNDPTINVTGNVTIDGTYTASNIAGSPLTIGGNLSIGGTYTGNTAPVNLAGDFANNGTFTSGAGTFTFNGGAVQNLTGTNAGTTTFTNMALNNANGLALSGNHNVTVGTSLTLTSGRITTNANILFISYTAGGGAIAGAGANDFVVGNLRKAYTANATQTRAFEVGTVAGGVRYAPVGVTLVVPAGGAGNFTVSSTAGDHPDIGSSTLDGSLSVNRYWTLTRDSVSITTSNNNSITFNYVAADNDSGTTASQFLVGRYVNPTWTEFTPAGTPTTTATTISGMSITQAGISGDYQVAQMRILVATRLHVVLPGQTFVAGTGVSGTPTDRTAGASFDLVRLVATDDNNFIATGYAGAKTIAYTGPGTGGGVPPSYTTAVSFTNGQSTTALATTLTLAQTTTLTASDGALTGVTSTPFNVVAGTANRMHVVLPGQSFVQGSGTTGTATDQVLNAPFLLSSLVVTDQFYNQATGYGSSPAVTWTLAPTAAGSTFTSPVSFSAGVSTTSLVTRITAANTYTLTASAAGLTGVQSSAFSVRESFSCSGWLYRKLITINPGQVGAGGVTDFPVLVRLTDTDLRDKALATGADIAFTDLTGTVKYDHEIERYTGATGELIAWVKLPSVSSSAGTQFYMNYGNVSAAPQQNPSGVWSNGYRMVHHLEETGGLGAALTDSTANANHGTVAGTGATFPASIAAPDGFIDGARSHPGVTAATPPALNFPSSGTLTITGAQTAEAWAYVESGQPAPDHNPILWKGTTIGWGTAYQFRIAVGPGGVMTWGVTCGTTEGYFEGGAPVLNNWAHYAMTWDGTTARAYINGVLQTITGNPAGTTACGGQALNTNAEPVRSGFALRGETAGQQTFLRGRTDELRVSAVARSAAWLQTQYNNQSSPATFYSVGPELGQICLDHIRIEHDGIGLTCAPKTVTVKACIDSTCSTTYAGGVTTTLTPTGWVGSDNIAFSGGSTTAQLRRTTTGTITLGAVGTAPAPAIATRCFNGATETCSLEFKDSGFIFASVPTPLTACKPSGTFTIQAVRKDLTTQNCTPAFAGSRSVNFSTTYISPASGSKFVTLNSVELDAPKNLTLTFNASATADLTMTYPDAGEVRLNASFTGSGAESGLSMTGLTTFVSAPVGLAVIPSGGACPTGDAGCAAYKKAGEAFNHTVRAACWTADGDTDLTDNPLTPNFEMASIPLTTTLVAPSGGANPPLGVPAVTFVGGTGGDGGTKTVSQTVNEVGVFTIKAEPAAGGYFGLTVPAGTSPNIGRFYPDHFSAGAGTFPPGCSASTPFTYLGQTFGISGVQLQARNAGNGVTQNYTGSFAKFAPGAIGNWGFAARDTDGAGTALPMDTGAASVTGGWSNGTLAADFSSIAIARPAAPAGPYDNAKIGIAPVDSDGVAIGSPDLDADGVGGNDHAQIASGVFRFGRLRVQAVAGSAVIDARVPLQLQYWSGTGFALNTDDACTTLSPGDFALSDYRLNLNAGETMATSVITLPSEPGRATLIMSKPGTNNTGSVLVKPDLGAAGKSYLRGAWTGSTWDKDPAARVGFGVYGGQPRNFIFNRENY